MKFTTNIIAFTLMELMIVVSIIGFLAKISTDTFVKMHEKALYEKAIYTIQQHVQEARARSLINEAKYDSLGDSYSAARGHGVVITRVSVNQIQAVLFQDNDNNGALTAGEEMKKLSEKNVLQINSLSGTVSETDNAAAAFTEATIYFPPDPDPKAVITTNVPENLRDIEIKFSHLRRNGPPGFHFKFSFNTLNRISEVNSYPILVDVERTNDNTITLAANEELQTIADLSPYLSNFTVKQGSTLFSPNGGSISGENISLNFAGALPDNGDPIEVNFSTNINIQTTENVMLRPRELEIEL